MAWGRDFSGVSWSAAVYAALLEAALLPQPHPPKAGGGAPAPRAAHNPRGAGGRLPARRRSSRSSAGAAGRLLWARAPSPK